jgi:hypothetical protein
MLLAWWEACTVPKCTALLSLDAAVHWAVTYPRHHIVTMIVLVIVRIDMISAVDLLLILDVMVLLPGLHLTYHILILSFKEWLTMT